MASELSFPALFLGPRKQLPSTSFSKTCIACYGATNKPIEQMHKCPGHGLMRQVGMSTGITFLRIHSRQSYSTSAQTFILCATTVTDTNRSSSIREKDAGRQLVMTMGPSVDRQVT